MKRSEMVWIIAGKAGMLKREADHILTLIEKAGMIPPHLKGQGITNVYGWEKEDEEK